MRDELLNETLFLGPRHTARPHSAPGYLTPTDNVALRDAGRLTTTPGSDRDWMSVQVHVTHT